MAVRRPWTPEEEEVFLTSYSTIGVRGVAKRLERTPASVMSKAKRLQASGLKIRGWRDVRRWSAEEDAVLRHGLRTMLARLPGRTAYGVQNRIWRLCKGESA